MKKQNTGERERARERWRRRVGGSHELRDGCRREKDEPAVTASEGERAHERGQHIAVCVCARARAECAV
eukprot:600863-Rhodomonas_salina.2